jgi:hypothetical protein
MKEKHAAFRTLGALFIAIFVMGCAQEDPDEIDGEDGGTASHPPWVWQCAVPGSGGAGTGSYFPTSGGSQWSYHRHGGLDLTDSGDLVPDDDTWENLTVEEVDYQGEAAFLFQDSPNRQGEVTKNWLLEKGDVVLRAHKEEFDEDDLDTEILVVDYYLGIAVSEVPDIDYYEDGFKRFDERWLDQAPGWAEIVAYNRKATLDLTGTEGNLNKETVRVHQFEVEAVGETVTVAAGTFDGCLKIKRERMREPGSNATDNERFGDVKRYWFCPGVGKVKEQEVNDDPRTEELLYHCIPDGLCCD